MQEDYVPRFSFLRFAFCPQKGDFEKFMCVSHYRIFVKSGKNATKKSEDEMRNFLVEQCVEWLTSIQLLAAGCTALLFCLQDHYGRPRAFFQLHSAEIDRSIVPSQDD